MKITPSLDKLSDEELDLLRIKLREDKCTAAEKRLIVHDMAYHQCSWIEIATVLGVTRNKIEEKYRDILNIAQTELKHDLRRLQFISGSKNKGNATMLIWLGKQYLEQSDTPQMEIKKDQFDEFIEWIKTEKTPSSLPVPSKSIAS